MPLLIPGLRTAKLFVKVAEKIGKYLFDKGREIFNGSGHDASSPETASDGVPGGNSPYNNQAERPPSGGSAGSKDTPASSPSGQGTPKEGVPGRFFSTFRTTSTL